MDGTSKDIAEPSSKTSSSSSARRPSLTDLLKKDAPSKVTVGQAIDVVEEINDKTKVTKVADVDVKSDSGSTLSGLKTSNEKSKDDEGAPVISAPGDKIPTKTRVS